MDAYRAVVDKRDQRAFLPKPIPDEALRRILQAARMTGSSKNARAQPPRRRARSRAPRRASPRSSRFAEVPRDSAARDRHRADQRHEFDAGRCAQNMMVAAWNDGIGSCPAHLPETEVAKLLGIPADVHVNRVIALRLRRPGARGRAENPSRASASRSTSSCTGRRGRQPGLVVARIGWRPSTPATDRVAQGGPPESEPGDPICFEGEPSQGSPVPSWGAGVAYFRGGPRCDRPRSPHASMNRSTAAPSGTHQERAVQ